MIYATIQDIIDYEVKPALGDYADNYDMRSIAGACFAWDSNKGGFVPDADADFWDVVRVYDLTDAN